MDVVAARSRDTVLRIGPADRLPQAQTRVEAQLRERVASLETRVAELTHCLERAENRAAALTAAQERVRLLEAELASTEASQSRIDELERRLSVITTSRSWQMTKPVRTAMSRVRGGVGHRAS